MKLASTITLPAVGLTGFETPLDEEERVIQQSVHRFARDVLRPLGRELDRMSAEEVSRPGSPYYSVFAEVAKLGLDSDLLAQLSPETAIRVESMIGEEMGWGDAGLAVSLVGHAVSPRDGEGRRQPGTGRTQHRPDRLLDDHASRQGHRCRRLRHEARMGAGATGQQGQPAGQGAQGRDRDQRPVLGLGLEWRRRAGCAGLHERRLRRGLLRCRWPSAWCDGDLAARPAGRLAWQAAGEDRPARAAAGRSLLRQRPDSEAFRDRAARRVLRQRGIGLVVRRHAHGSDVHRRRACGLRDGPAVLPRAQAGGPAPDRPPADPLPHRAT